MAITIFAAGGKQYKVTAGDTIFVEKIEGNAGDKVSFDQVLMVGAKLGNPFISGAKVECTIEKQGKQKKIRIIKFKAKKHHFKRQGHRQPYTKLKVDAVTGI